MNKRYNILAKLVFLIFLILIIIGIIFGNFGNKKVIASDLPPGVSCGGVIKQIRYISTPITIQSNQFWSADFDYEITAQVTILASTSLSIENGASISISNNAYFDIEGGVLNIGFATGTSGVSTTSVPAPSASTDFLSDINSVSNSLSGGLMDLFAVDNVFDSTQYKSQPTLNSQINISGVGYNNIFNINNGGVVNIRKTNIEGWKNSIVSGDGTATSGYNDLERTLFGVYRKSKLNIFETNINNVEVKGTQAFYAYDNSQIILYRSNVNGFAGNEFSNIFKSSSLNIFRTKITDARVNNGVGVYSKSILNFQKSSISANPLVLASSGSGTCFSGYSGTTVNVLNSDIGPCFKAFNFSGTGNFKVNQNNFSGNGDVVLNFSPYVDFKNNWWGRSDGPRPLDLSSLDPDGNYSNDDYIKAIKNQNAVEDYSNGVVSVPFSPTPFREAVPCCSSVLFIPGIQSSRLYKRGLFGTENQLWEPNRNKDAESLFLNSSGQTKDSSIYTRDIIAKTNFFGPIGAIDIYQSLIDFFAKEKSDKNINDFQTLAYDWRMLPSNILSSGIKTDSYTVMLKDKIKEMAKAAPSGKVIIVAHSYGGLLAKSLMEDLEKEGQDDLIESVALVSVPEYGTPQAIPSLFYGDNEDLLGGLILSKSTAISLGKNMLSAHLLLPSSSYFTESYGVQDGSQAGAQTGGQTGSQVGSQALKNIISFDNWVSSKYKLGLTKIDSYSETADFLKNKNIVSSSGINSSLYDRAETEHDLIDNYSANLSAKTYSIVAVGIPTLSSMTYVKPKCRGFFFCSSSNTSLPDFTRKYSLMGDGVVIAHNLGRRTGSVFTVDIGKENEIKKTAPVYFREDPISHKDVFRSSGVKDVLHAILSRSKKESEMVNSFGLLSNPYVSYVSGSLSKPGPILGAYGNSSIFSGISKIAEDAADSDFMQRFNNSKMFTIEAYGPIILKTNYQNISDLQNKPFDQLNLENRIVNYTKYSDSNRVGVVSAVYSGTNSGTSGVGTNIFGQGSGVGTVQIVTKIDNKEVIYPNTSITPSTVVGVDSSTTTIAIDNNGDGTADKIIKPLQINDGTSTDSMNASTSSESIDDLFVKAKVRIQKFVSGGGTTGTAGISTPVSAPFATSSVYLANKYIEKLDVAQRRYQKFGVFQSLNQLKSFYGTMESNMNVISNLIITYNKEQGFYVLNNFLETNKKVLFLNQRQKEIREEILVYLEIHDAFAELMQKMGEGL